MVQVEQGSVFCLACRDGWANTASKKQFPARADRSRCRACSWERAGVGFPSLLQLLQLSEVDAKSPVADSRSVAEAF